jgi:hypothetical protein
MPSMNWGWQSRIIRGNDEPPARGVVFMLALVRSGVPDELRRLLSEGERDIEAIIDELPIPFENEEMSVVCDGLSDEAVPLLRAENLPEATYLSTRPASRPDHSGDRRVVEDLLECGAPMPRLAAPHPPTAPQPPRAIAPPHGGRRAPMHADMRVGARAALPDAASISRLEMPRPPPRRPWPHFLSDTDDETATAILDDCDANVLLALADDEADESGDLVLPFVEEALAPPPFANRLVPAPGTRGFRDIPNVAATVSLHVRILHVAKVAGQ